MTYQRSESGNTTLDSIRNAQRELTVKVLLSLDHGPLVDNTSMLADGHIAFIECLACGQSAIQSEVLDAEGQLITMLTLPAGRCRRSNAIPSDAPTIATSTDTNDAPDGETDAAQM